MEETLGFVFGRKGSGKSTLLRALVRHQLMRRDRLFRFVVYDSTREWSVPPESLPDQLLVLPDWQCSVEDAAHEALQRAPCTLVVDEIEQYCPNKGGLWDLPGSCVPAIVYRGRHFRTGLLCATQRPGKVHQSIFGLADWIFAFYTTLYADLDRVARELGPEVADAVQNLAPHAFVRYDL